MSCILLLLLLLKMMMMMMMTIIIIIIIIIIINLFSANTITYLKTLYTKLLLFIN